MSQSQLKMADQKATHLLTFDLEHWYQGYRYRGGGGWEGLPARDHSTVERLLQMLDEAGANATFFTTGVFAAEFPGLMKTLVMAGHEVASHSYDHALVTAFTTNTAFQQDLHKSISIIEDATGEKVFGFRAPKWSMPKSPGTFYDALLDEGLIYDSSLFPGMRASHIPRQPYRGLASSGRGIWEIPATTLDIGPVRIPAAGGLWLRLFPGGFSYAALRQGSRVGQIRMVYLHPYDIDAECPILWRGLALRSLPFLFARHYRLAWANEILTSLLSEFHFVGIREYLRLCAMGREESDGGNCDMAHSYVE